ncbi:conserved hypothetical protein [Mesorhizobium plurifarium]|uniref:Uncharacterized protein n=1 Tax=Mesorhizobium plurifarium TaxID=69974 RepID=A0A0K2VYS3_MESPL|nr:conserved hypothetical protein [Mesorhizobium plurifarium]
MNGESRITMVAEASGHSLKQTDRPLNVAKKQRAGIRCDRSAVKTGDNFVAVEAFKFELVGSTVCGHRTPFLNLITLCCKSSFSDSWGRCTSFYEIFRLGLRGCNDAVEWIE